MIARAIRIYDSDSDSFEDALDEALGVSLENAKHFPKNRKGSSDAICFYNRS